MYVKACMHHLYSAVHALNKIRPSTKIFFLDVKLNIIICKDIEPCLATCDPRGIVASMELCLAMGGPRDNGTSTLVDPEPRFISSKSRKMLCESVRRAKC